MSIEKIINDAWKNKDQVNPNSDQSIKDAINQVIEDLDSGKSRVAENPLSFNFLANFNPSSSLSPATYTDAILPIINLGIRGALPTTTQFRIPIVRP